MVCTDGFAEPEIDFVREGSVSPDLLQSKVKVIAPVNEDCILRFCCLTMGREIFSGLDFIGCALWSAYVFVNPVFAHVVQRGHLVTEME